MPYTLLIDDRERTETKIAEEITHPNIEIRVERITSGDYAILDGDSILMLFERKTWRDMAASIKDGRKENVKNLIDIRANFPTCRLFYIIEGKSARYEPTKRLAGIPFKNLQAHLDHLILRDNINILYSKSHEDTFSRIFEIFDSFVKLFGQVNDNSAMGGKELLKKRHIKSDDEILFKIYKCIPGIGEEAIALLRANRVSISDIICGNLDCDSLSNMTFKSGTKFGATKANKLCGLSQSPDYRKICEKMLSCINGITIKSASTILDQISMTDLFSGYALEKLGEIKIGEKKLGAKKAAAIIGMFNHLPIEN